MRPYLSVAACVLFVNCGGARDASPRDSVAVAPSPAPAAAPAGEFAAAMVDSAGLDHGSVTLADGPQGIAMSGTLSNLPPGEHGIHLHAVGRCEPPYESAGAHWNPANRQHGTLNPQGPHRGDLANITVATDGSVAVQISTTGGTLRAADALLDTDGAALVIHAKADDNRTDPSGNSGDRIVCGVVQNRPS